MTSLSLNIPYVSVSHQKRQLHKPIVSIKTQHIFCLIVCRCCEDVLMPVKIFRAVELDLYAISAAKGLNLCKSDFWIVKDNQIFNMWITRRLVTNVVQHL